MGAAALEAAVLGVAALEVAVFFTGALEAPLAVDVAVLTVFFAAVCKAGCVQR